MADTVLNKVLMKCRRALLGGVPIIYIRTDSDVFIQRLITCEENPLIVLLSNGGRQGNETERELKKGRPIYELTEPQDKQLTFCLNYKFGVPVSIGEIYNELYVSKNDYASKNDLVSGKMKGPFLWTFKLPADAEKYYSDLEKYILNHENINHPQYKILQNSAVILYSSRAILPEMLSTYTEFIDVDYPDDEEIRKIITTEAESLRENENYLSALSTDFLGFTSEEISLTMRRIVSTSNLENSDEVEAIISEHKRQKLQGGLLEQCITDGNIGGMKNFRTWLKSQVNPLKNSGAYMRKTGTPPPKGVLLCGIPGCGKSEAAKFTAQVLDLPLLKMDIGSLMDKYQGVSEQKMRDALKLAEAMSPCVLWIDELEKGFSGASSSDEGGSASFKRMFGYMLGWMQDNTKPCFIFATANDIGGLPKEFFRSGRFDALYAVYLPTAGECSGIFQACMERARRNISRATRIPIDDVNLFDKSCYSDLLFRNIINENFVRSDGKPRIIIGSDIQKAVNLALRKLADEKIITGEIWQEALKSVIIDPTFCVYGDGEENIDSIAVSYCRMLRKGFIPASDDILFMSKDYHIENAEKYAKLKNIDTERMKPEELAEHEKKISQAEILQGNFSHSENKYDYALYSCLRERINKAALLLEKHEREMMIRR